MTLKIYPGAYHIFDIEGVDSDWGGYIHRYDEAAAKDAFGRVRAFLRQHLKWNFSSTAWLSFQ